MGEPGGASADEWARRVARAVLAQWAALPRTGKPQMHEFAVLAAITLSFEPQPEAGRSEAGQPDAPACSAPGSGGEGPELAVVAIGTGTKCLGGRQRRPGGLVLNDCHAEALCRRALLLWLHAEALALLRALRHGAPRYTRALRLVWVPGGEPAGGGGAGGWRLALQPGVRLHLFVTQPPCGDAGVIERECACGAGRHGGNGSGVANGGNGNGGNGNGGDNGNGGFLRTGAKPLKRPRLEPPGAEPPAPAPGEAAQPGAPEQLHAQALPPQAHEVESYSAPQAVGVARRKPGRGDATLSLSCSDKIAKWGLLGLQGSLLSGLLATPLYLSSLTALLPLSPSCAEPAAAHAAAGSAAARRAVWGRTAPLRARLRLPFDPERPEAVVLCDPGMAPQLDRLGVLETPERRTPCGASVLWHAAPSGTWAQHGAGGIPKLPAGVVEAVSGATGLRAGCAKPKNGAPITRKGVSSAAKVALFEAWAHLGAALRDLPAPEGAIAPAPATAPAAHHAERLETYREAKLRCGAAYQAAWRALLEAPSPLEGWIAKPAELEEFAIDGHSF